MRSPLCMMAYWHEQSAKKGGYGLSALRNRTGWKPCSSDLPRKRVLPGVSGEVIPTFPVEAVPSCREECQSNEPTRRCMLPVSQLLGKCFNRQVIVKKAWSQPWEYFWARMSRDVLLWSWLSEITMCSKLRSPWAHMGCKCCSGLQWFFTWEQGDTRCSLDLGILGKHVQHRKVGDTYRERALVHRWDWCA